MRLILNWIISAIGLLIVTRLVSGFEVSSFLSALIAALVIGLVNATLGFFLKIITFPFIVLTLGIFWFVINALMLKFASLFVPGFHIFGFAPAFWGAIVLSIINLLFRSILPKREPA